MQTASQQLANLARELDAVTADEAFEQAIDIVARRDGLSAEEANKLRLSSRNQLTGYGVLQKYFEDESIEEIWINQPNEIHFARSGISEREFVRLTESELQALVERMLRYSGRRLDRSSPFVDAALEDGSRLHVVIPDITRRHWSINIRKFPASLWRLQQLVDKQVLTEVQAKFLAEQIRAGKNILVSGATQAGKTTLLCALIAETPARTRLVTVEETFEIRSINSDWVAMQTRQPNLEGKGEVTLRRLVKESLRMRPELLVVGEVREAESLDLLIAMNSGIPGLCTIHANSAAEALRKLCTLPLLAGANISAEFVKQTVESCMHYVVHCAMDSEGHRRVVEIMSVQADD